MTTWTYDLKTEELRDDKGAIGHVEPVSGPLCAAAPDLLAACEAALSRFVDQKGGVAFDEVADALFAAIAKARGGA